MKKTKLIVKTKSKSYPIYFGSNILKSTGVLVKKNLPGVKKICVISDNKLPKVIIKELIKSLKKQLAIINVTVAPSDKVITIISVPV